VSGECTKMRSMTFPLVISILCGFLTVVLSSGDFVKFHSTDDFEKQVLSDKYSWLIAGLESDLSTSRHFERDFVPKLQQLVGSWVRVGSIQVEDLPKDMQKPSLEHLQRGAPLLWLVHRKTRTMKELILTMDPDGSLHPSSIVPEIKRQLDLSKSSGGAKLKLGYLAEEKTEEKEL